MATVGSDASFHRKANRDSSSQVAAALTTTTVATALANGDVVAPTKRPAALSKEETLVGVDESLGVPITPAPKRQCTGDGVSGSPQGILNMSMPPNNLRVGTQPQACSAQLGPYDSRQNSHRLYWNPSSLAHSAPSVASSPVLSPQDDLEHLHRHRLTLAPPEGYWHYPQMLSSVQYADPHLAFATTPISPADDEKIPKKHPELSQRMLPQPVRSQVPTACMLPYGTRGQGLDRVATHAIPTYNIGSSFDTMPRPQPYSFPLLSSERQRPMGDQSNTTNAFPSFEQSQEPPKTCHNCLD